MSALTDFQKDHARGHLDIAAFQKKVPLALITLKTFFNVVCYGVVCYVVVCYGVLWCGVLWCGVCGVVCYVVVCYGVVCVVCYGVCSGPGATCSL